MACAKAEQDKDEAQNQGGQKDKATTGRGGERKEIYLIINIPKGRTFVGTMEKKQI